MQKWSLSEYFYWFNLSKLITLSISDNQLTTLPQEIGNLSELKNLYISKNELTVLPKELFKLTNSAFFLSS